MLKSTDFLVSC